ncbi:MAG: transporter, partial [Pseudomonadota bacterium]
LAYVLRRLDFPLAPLVLGLVLGKLFDEFLRNALTISDGSLMPIFERPISLTIFVFLMLFFVASTPILRRPLTRLLRGNGRVTQDS